MNIEMIILDVPRYAVKFIIMGVFLVIYLIIQLISVSVRKSRYKRQQKQQQLMKAEQQAVPQNGINKNQISPGLLNNEEKLKSTTPLLQPTIVKAQTKSISIGRSPDNDIVISNDGRVSRHHSKISTDNENNVFIEDMDSSNGTFVNGKSVKKFCLYKGDIIKVGDTQINWERHFFH